MIDSWTTIYLVETNSLANPPRIRRGSTRRISVATFETGYSIALVPPLCSHFRLCRCSRLQRGPRLHHGSSYEHQRPKDVEIGSCSLYPEEHRDESSQSRPVGCQLLTHLWSDSENLRCPSLFLLATIDFSEACSLMQGTTTTVKRYQRVYARKNLSRERRERKWNT